MIASRRSLSRLRLMLMRSSLFCLVALSLTACGPVPQSQFWDRLALLCGQAFEGEIVSEDAPTVATASDLKEQTVDLEGSEVEFIRRDPSDDD